ncbi:hypothetical protein HC081234_13610 [Helicobacter cinaedi]|nr:hypothetical protein HC081234_13610 [Helicobacter cinaedi]
MQCETGNVIKKSLNHSIVLKMHINKNFFFKLFFLQFLLQVLNMCSNMLKRIKTFFA